MSHRRPRSLSRSIAALVTAALGALVIPAAATPADAADVGIRFDGSPGTAAPPSALGGYLMTPFEPDSQAHTWVDSAEGPSGDVAFYGPMYHATVGNGWATWSHGYTGDVYQSSSSNETITLPQGTRAFYFYAEPDPFDYIDIVAQTADGTSSGDVIVNGRGGARYYGFYATGAEPLSLITISSSTDFAIGEFGIASDDTSAAAAQVLFVHGVTQKFTDDSLFAGLRDPLAVTYGADLVNSFEYYQDKGDETGSGCDPLAPGQATPPTPDPAVGMPYDASQNGAVCDSQGDIGQNAVRLDHEVERLYHAHDDKPVILMGYSMGGETIRSMLAYSTYTGDGVADTMVDSVLLMHGVEQGSWIASASGIADLPLAGGAISDLIGQIAPNPGRPAVREFSPSGAYMRWLASHSDRLPDIPMYNTWGDERVYMHSCALYFFCHDTFMNSAGDVILEPGTDDPTETPSGGGHRFLPGGPSATRWQWAETQKFYWDPTVDDKMIMLMVDLIKAPMSHSNYPHHQDELTVNDCQTGEAVNETTELLRVVTARMEGTTYTCAP